MALDIFTKITPVIDVTLVVGYDFNQINEEK